MSFHSKVFKERFTPSIKHDGDGSFWIGTKGQGAKRAVIGANEEIEVIESVLTGYSVSAIQPDSNGNTWFSTIERGVALLTPNVQFFMNQTSSGFMEAVRNKGDSLFYSTPGNDLFMVTRTDKGFEQTFVHSGIRGKTEIRINGDNLSFRSGPEHWDFELGDLSQKKKVAELSFGRRVLVNGAILYFKDGTRLDTIQNPWKERLRISFDMDTANIYFGGFTGAHHYNPTTREVSTFDQNILGDFRCAARLKYDTVILGTKGDGLFLVQSQNLIGQLRSEDYDISTVLKMASKEGTVWFITPSGLFTIEQIVGETVRCFRWNDLLGIGSVSMKNIFSWNDHMVLSFADGTMIFDPTEVRLKGKPPVIYGIRTIGEDTLDFGPLGRVELSYDKAGLKVLPKTVAFSNRVGGNFRYRLLPKDTVWSMASTLPISFTSLPEGGHNLELAARNRFGDWTLQPGVLNIYVSGPFWRAWWFVLGIVMLFTIGLTAVYSFRERRIKQTTKLRMEIAESQNKALSLQLNPHFLFNSLNSIIAYLSVNDLKPALRYLGKYAKMMRNIFENSALKLLTINDELNAVRLYIELESLRLDNNFDFNLSIDENLDIHELQMPPLILQPIVENAIWHGVVPLTDRQGIISLSVKPCNGRIEIMISDNGPGNSARSTASQIKKSRVKSVQLIEQRFELLNRMYKGTFEFRSYDNLPVGYQVKVLMPFITNDKIIS